jgi:tetratricopeptide (TPR) repeat protein
MTVDLQRPESDQAQSGQPGGRRWNRRRLLAVLVGLAVILALGVSLNARRPENCYRRGRRALLAGDRETVLRESRRLLATRGFEPRGRLLAGLLYARSGQADQALWELQSAAEDEALAVEALTAGAECYYNLGKLLEAVDLSKKAILLDDSALDAHRWQAAALYDLGATSLAAAELEIVSRQAPDDPLPERLLGLIDNDAGEYSHAIEHYHESLRRGLRPPERETVAMELAQALLKQHQIDKALEALRDANHCPLALILKAECREIQGRIEESQTLLRDAVDLDPQFFTGKLKLGASLLHHRRAEDAVAVLRDAARLAPYSSQAHFLLAQAYSQTGERASADAELQLMRRAQAEEREFSELHLTASQSPSDAEARYRLGLLAHRRNDPKQARMWFRAALAIQPEHAASRLGLAELDAATGHP